MRGTDATKSGIPTKLPLVGERSWFGNHRTEDEDGNLGRAAGNPSNRSVRVFTTLIWTC